MIQRDLGNGMYASYDEDVPKPVLLGEYAVVVSPRTGSLYFTTVRAASPLEAFARAQSTCDQWLPNA